MGVGENWTTRLIDPRGGNFGSLVLLSIVNLDCPQLARCVDDTPRSSRAIPRKVLHISRCPGHVAASISRVLSPISIQVTSTWRRSKSPPNISILSKPWNVALSRNSRASLYRIASMPVAVRMMASGVMWRVPMIRSIAFFLLVRTLACWRDPVFRHLVIPFFVVTGPRGGLWDGL